MPRFQTLGSPMAVDSGLGKLADFTGGLANLRRQKAANAQEIADQNRLMEWYMGQGGSSPEPTVDPTTGQVIVSDNKSVNPYLANLFGNSTINTPTRRAAAQSIIQQMFEDPLDRQYKKAQIDAINDPLDRQYKKAQIDAINDPLDREYRQAQIDATLALADDRRNPPAEPPQYNTLEYYDSQGHKKMKRVAETGIEAAVDDIIDSGGSLVSPDAGKSVDAQIRDWSIISDRAAGDYYGMTDASGQPLQQGAKDPVMYDYAQKRLAELRGQGQSKNDPASALRGKVVTYDRHTGEKLPERPVGRESVLLMTNAASLLPFTAASEQPDRSRLITAWPRLPQALRDKLAELASLNTPYSQLVELDDVKGYLP